MRTRLIAKTIVLDESYRVLLIRRSKDDDRRPGEQDFPGGSIEPHEDIIAGVCREIREEIGLNIPTSQIHVFYTKTEVYKNLNIVRVVCWVRLTRPEIVLSFEHDEYEWFSMEAAIQAFPHPVYGKAIEYGMKNRIFM